MNDMYDDRWLYEDYEAEWIRDELYKTGGAEAVKRFDEEQAALRAELDDDTFEYEGSTYPVNDVNAPGGFRYMDLEEMRRLLPEYKQILADTDKILSDERDYKDWPVLENGKLVAAPEIQLKLARYLDAEDRFLEGSKECFVIEDHPRYVSLVIFPYLGKAFELNKRIWEYDDRIYMNGYCWGSLVRYYAGYRDWAGKADQERYEFRFWKNKEESALPLAERLLRILKKMVDDPDKVVNWIDEKDFSEWDDW